MPGSSLLDAIPLPLRWAMAFSAQKPATGMPE
jgi:hypothetical protein